MIQLHNSAGSWNRRYLAGRRSPITAGWGPMLPIADTAPAEWVVVTRDLFKDFGPMRLTGLALTPMDGGSAGLFDNYYLGRTVADLDRASAVAFGKEALPDPLARPALEKLWRDMAAEDVTVAGRAVRTLVAGRKESVAFLSQRLRQRPPAVGEKQILAWIADLDDNLFRVREAATRELDRLGEAAVPWLRKAVAASGSTEAQRRVKALLKRRAAEQEEVRAVLSTLLEPEPPCLRGNGQEVAVRVVGAGYGRLGNSCGPPELSRRDTDEALEVVRELALLWRPSGRCNARSRRWMSPT
jgi:hypothetical protein